MHLIAAIPGGWNPNDEGVFHIEQSPGDLVFLSPADTEIALFNDAYRRVKENWKGANLPSVRLVNLLYMKQELTIDTYIEEVLSHAKIIVCRLLGGRRYYPYFLDAVTTLCIENKIPLVVLSSYELDLSLINSSTVSNNTAHKVWRYLEDGGIQNYKNCIKYIFNEIFGINIPFEEVHSIPEIFLFRTDEQKIITQDEQNEIIENQRFNVAVIAYRTHYLSENLDPIKLLCKRLKNRGFNPVLLFVHHLRDHDSELILGDVLTNNGERNIDLIINTTSFAIKDIGDQSGKKFLFDKLKSPVLQAIMAGCTYDLWKNTKSGLTPTDIAMNIALPEIDGKIISSVISFKGGLEKDEITDSEILKYQSFDEGCESVLFQTEKWLELKSKKNKDKKVALIMPNYPNKDSRLANGVGLDTPASCINILKSLDSEGYNLGTRYPENSEELITLITQTITNDEDTAYIKRFNVFIDYQDFSIYYNRLNPELRNKIESQWGPPVSSPFYSGDGFGIAGIKLGNVFLSIQPSRGFNRDPKAIYHSPDLPPTPDYLAYYFWINHVFKADAIIHVGKHGNLEWLPGKSLALSKESCFPAVLYGDIPHFYPFIVNDPGEGTQAKRRTSAVVLDHLIPPITRAESYGDYEKLEHLIEEFYECANQDFKRETVVKKKILKLVEDTNLGADLNINTNDINEVLVAVDGYLCELKEAQIRGGLHIFGELPKQEKLVDLIIALHRLPMFQENIPGITQALAKDLEINFDPLETNYEESFQLDINGVKCRTKGKVIEQLELMSKERLGHFLNDGINNIESEFGRVLHYIESKTLPNLRKTKQEISNLIGGLNGRYVESGASGAPTSGKLDVLPTGRNFYSVDIRTVPTEVSYELGVKSANLIVDRYLQEHGEYPNSIGISVWGTATMRTGGDDISQAMALIGVKPVWDHKSRRVSDFEVLPLLQLNRPRIDVLLRISGFFRDAFPDLIRLFNRAVERVANLDEPLEDNPIRKRFLEEKNEWLKKGLSVEMAYERSLLRVFGSKPGAYGAGLQAVIDEKNWNDPRDLANIYIQWGGYAYTKELVGKSAHESFVKRLSNLEIVMHNQDNREHDILDSDDYYQFQGGMANAVKEASGSYPEIYFGDHAKKMNPQVKTLKQELLKVFRSRVVNPKWINAMKEHGYKGVFEMAATLDYMFAYDATTNLVEDFMYEGIANAYLMDEELLEHIRDKNPWAVKDMSERLLEAIQRGMWGHPSNEMKSYLESLYLKSEEVLEV